VISPFKIQGESPPNLEREHLLGKQEGKKPDESGEKRTWI